MTEKMYDLISMDGYCLMACEITRENIPVFAVVKLWDDLEKPVEIVRMCQSEAYILVMLQDEAYRKPEREENRKRQAEEDKKNADLVKKNVLRKRW